jgi:hypothetical protein
MVETILLPCQNFCFINPIDEYEFHPIPIDIHLGIIKVPNVEILDDFGINTIESVIVGTNRSEVLNGLQTAFVREFRRFGTLKETDSLQHKYEVKQAWTRIRIPIKNIQINNKEASARD